MNSADVEKRMKREEEQIRRFCKVCDYYPGDTKGFRCRNYRVSIQIQRQAIMKGWCSFGRVLGEDVFYITPVYVETKSRKRYTRESEGSLRTAMKTRQGLDAFDMDKK